MSGSGYGLKVESNAEGWHPSEAMVTFTDADGAVQCLFTDKCTLADDVVKVGWPLDRRSDALLVQLPRETMSGAWRVWMPESALVELA